MNSNKKEPSYTCTSSGITSDELFAARVLSLKPGHITFSELERKLNSLNKLKRYGQSYLASLDYLTRHVQNCPSCSEIYAQIEFPARLFYQIVTNNPQ